MGSIEVLFRSSAGSRVVRVPLDKASAGTAQQLQASLERACGLPRGAVERLAFHGQPLQPSEDLRCAGVSCGGGAAAAGAPGSDEAVYPNGWVASVLGRAYQRRLDPSWPPVRHADFVTGFGWIFAALAALAATSLLPCY